ncbi:hypothetical protein [Peteryoungia ipomoeae]|uniref:hypothetical protein n=1 Tax=Peteryoungia ipomoeae TaxID=1210932 RepID=UPI0014562C3E|nr:hypothetical protein [Peteryoungia ipomoeae]
MNISRDRRLAQVHDLREVSLQYSRLHGDDEEDRDHLQRHLATDITKRLYAPQQFGKSLHVLAQSASHCCVFHLVSLVG